MSVSQHNTRDARFNNSEKKLMAKMKFPEEFATKVNLNMVHIDVMRPWVTKKVIQYVGFEDDIIINMVMAEMEKDNNPDPRLMQINLTGFLERNAGAFMAELWKLLISAQVASPSPLSHISLGRWSHFSYF
ncbi:PWI domain-containing protein [Baffinella frigidus]|nr:PWI domain-containing protein [Cryptophyta sp. CCMP2293]